MLLYAYLLVATGIGLAALSLIHLLVSTAPVVWGGDGGEASLARAAQGIVLGLGVAGVGFALLRLRLLQPSGKVSGLEKGRTGWALGAGVLVGAALAAGAAFVLAPSDGGEPRQGADTARAARSVDTPAAEPSARSVRTRRSPDTAVAAASDSSRSPAEADTAPATAGERTPVTVDTVRGTVRLVGSTPFVRTVVEGSDTLTVTGRWESEIGRLSGARVEVVGPVTTSGYPGPTMEARRYELLAVDGERPAVGVLRGEGGAFYLETAAGDSVGLEAVPASFGDLGGAKLWVVTGEEGAVRRYGVLRPPVGGAGTGGGSGR